MRSRLRAVGTLGVLHRDLKPGDILLASGSTPVAGTAVWTAVPEPTDGRQTSLSQFRAKIADFGLAKLPEPASVQSQSGIIAGTPQYMAPEQVKGESAGPAADIYALGAVLYELVAGHPPFAAERPVDLLVQVLQVEPPPLRAQRPEVAADLEAVCLRCLEKAAHRRFPSAADLAQELRRFLNHQRTLTRPPGPIQRVRRWLRRHPVWSILIAVATLAVGGLTYHTVRLEAVNEALTAKLRMFVDEARTSGIVSAVVIDGSYVTSKAEPNDIDLVVAYRPDFDLKRDLRPFEYNVLSKNAIRRAYRFDAFVLPDGSDANHEWVRFFSEVRRDDPDLQTSRTRKGVLRIVL